ncbi:ABC transporter ATP-binding protein [Planctomicrobium sp. SH668]|uniref:ABC transporter ATP-binding protein n=1 Tax=Planctomicrobium sp. SH668 TaxID=3448126 RepID=UPI003F5BAFE2
MIELRDVKIIAGTFTLDRISCMIPTGAYAVLMGRTGSGKTTLLEAICGLRTVERGSIILNDQEITHIPPADRQIGYVPQDLALFPSMSVLENLEFALRIRRVHQSRIKQRIDELAGLLHLESLLKRSIKQLSGGESQRVALGRALAFRPEILLLDEPLSALDERTRSQMQDLLRSIRQVTQVTVLHVTHSREEANVLADQLYELENGRLQPSADH